MGYKLDNIIVSKLNFLNAIIALQLCRWMLLFCSLFCSIFWLENGIVCVCVYNAHTQRRERKSKDGKNINNFESRQRECLYAFYYSFHFKI